MLTVFMDNMEYLSLLGRNELPLASRRTMFTPSGGKIYKVNVLLYASQHLYDII